MSDGRLGPQERAASLVALRSQQFDVVVIGGGITGCGIALDAATRGFSVALIEARDIASGTSSRSSKLIHGGLRYLEMRDFGLVREALLERGLLTKKLAPHLVRPVPFVLSLQKGLGERLYVGAGLLLYDLLARLGRAPRLRWHRHLSRTAVAARWKSLRSDRFRGGIQYFDAQVDDARYTMMVARTAAAHGARIVNRCQVVDVLRDGDRVCGVRAIDDESPDDAFEVRARVVINASGVWVGDIASGGLSAVPSSGSQATVSLGSQATVRASKGIHLVVPGSCIDAETGLISRTEKSVLFVIPWGSHWIIGTTDTDWTLDKVHPAASRKDIQYVLERVNAILDKPITRAHLQGVYVGLRPLVASGDVSTAKLSREHAIVQQAPGLLAVSGGKYTTYRVMAKDAVDAAAPYIGSRKCRTEDVPIVGAGGIATNDRLYQRYGTLAEGVVALAADRPELLNTLPDTDEYIEAEVVYAVTHEGARHIEDVLTRRTRMSVETWSRGVAAAGRVALLMGEVLDWSAERVDLEVNHYVQRVAAERAANDAETDEEADAIRRAVPDVARAVRSRS